MKLLFACANSASDPNLWSGTVWNCRRGLEAAGVELAILDNIPFECPVRLRLLHQSYKRLGHQTHSLQSEPVILQRAADRIAARFAEGDCAAVFVPGSGVPVYAYLPPSIPTFPYLDATKLSWVRAYYGLDTLSARSRRHIDAVDRTSLQNAALTFFSSQWALDEAVSDYGIAPDRAMIVPFGANLTDPPSRVQIAGYIATRPWAPLNFLFLGVEWERKGGPEALAIVRELRRRGVFATLHVVGCTPTLGADDRELVQLHGFIDHRSPEGLPKFKQLLAQAHVLMFLSRAEAFGIALCEAAAFGVPLFGANTGGIPTVVRPGVNGWLAPVPFSPEAAATMLQGTLSRPDEYRRLAYGAREDFEKRLNWSTAASTLVRAMEQALVAHSTPA